MTLYSVAGLPVKIELPVPLIIDLLPVGQRLNRPGIPLLTPSDWIQHETDDERLGVNALAEARYLHNGAKDDNGVPQQASWHFTTDDVRIVQTIPVTEVSWQAADGPGPGNYRCISNELCVNPDSDWVKARHNAEALAGGILKALGRTVESVGNHWDYNYNNVASKRHRCPKHMLFVDGYWPIFRANVGAIIHPNEPTYAVASVPDWWTVDNLLDPIDRVWKGVTFNYFRLMYTARRDGVLAHVSASDSAALTRPPLKKGEQFIGVYRFKSAGVWWIMTKYGSRIRASHCSPWISVTG